MERFSDFEHVQTYLRTQWSKLTHQRGHPWRLVTLANVEGGQPRQRTVVVRRADWVQRTIRFYTDVRSQKMQTVERGQPFSWHFYHPRHQVQVQFTAQPMLVQEQERQVIWENLSLRATQDYRSVQTPGQQLQGEQDFLAIKVEGYPQFRVIDNQYHTLEVLQLHRDGHQRAVLEWDIATERWKGRWLVP